MLYEQKQIRLPYMFLMATLMAFAVISAMAFMAGGGKIEASTIGPIDPYKFNPADCTSTFTTKDNVKAISFTNSQVGYLCYLPKTGDGLPRYIKLWTNPPLKFAEMKLYALHIPTGKYSLIAEPDSYRYGPDYTRWETPKLYLISSDWVWIVALRAVGADGGDRPTVTALYFDAK